MPEASDEGACRATCKCVEGPDGEAQVRAKNIDEHGEEGKGKGVRLERLFKTTSVKDKTQKRGRLIVFNGEGSSALKSSARKICSTAKSRLLNTCRADLKKEQSA